jgi:nucleoid DNA-binding protein
MNKFLTPGRMADRLEDKVELDRETTGRFTSELFEIIIRELQNDDSFSLFGFGTFKKIYVAPNKGRNPQTGEAIYIPAHYRIKFSPAGKLAARINKEYSHLEPIILEQDEMIHEGLLLKAERYIMTASPEPEPEQIVEKTMIEEEIQEEQVEKTVVSVTEAEPETPVNEYIHHEPDFGFKKDHRNKTLKLALLSLVALLLILGLGWLIFRNNGPEPAAEIIIIEEPSVEEVPIVGFEPVPEPEPAAVIVEAETRPDTSYDIEPGDSFSLLAQKSWGNIYLWPYLYRRNSSSFPDPDLVKPGDNIVIPPQPDKENDQIRIEDSILFAYQRYRSLISEQENSPRNPNRELSAGYVLLGGERLYPSFLDRKKTEIRIEDIRKVDDLDL